MASSTKKSVYVLDGESLTAKALYEIGRDEECDVQVSKSAWTRIVSGRKIIDDAVKSGKVMYGVNTGFGNFATVVVPPEQVCELQRNLIRSHAAGVGDPLPVHRARMLLALRINVLAKGFSGVRPETVEAMLAALNKNVVSYVPEQGTVGASGDLAPLAHSALGLMGEGELWNPKEKKWDDAAKVLAENGLTPIELQAKEGLALINGTQLITSLGAEALERARLVALQADVVAALSLEALRGSYKPFDARIHAARPHAGQQAVAARIRALLLERRAPASTPDYIRALEISAPRSDAAALVEHDHPEHVASPAHASSSLFSSSPSSSCANPAHDHSHHHSSHSSHSHQSAAVENHEHDDSHAIPADSEYIPSEIYASHRNCGRVQDSYTLRCIPQVHGIVHDTIEFCRSLLETEMNSATDNPMVFANDDVLGHTPAAHERVISGGNFHGEYPAKSLDYLAIGVQEIANISERRIERFMNPQMSELPAFLVAKGGLNSGFMIAHCTAAALTSENKVYCHPASSDTISTSAGKEDHVSMGGWSARKALKLIENVEVVVAIELLAACQALEFLRPLKTTAVLEKVHALVRTKVEAYNADRYMAPLIKEATKLIRSGEVWNAVGHVLGCGF